MQYDIYAVMQYILTLISEEFPGELFLTNYQCRVVM